jgi:hypothetical protein
MVSSTTRSAEIVSATSGAASGRLKMNTYLLLCSPEGLRFRGCCEAQDGGLDPVVLREECPAARLQTCGGRGTLSRRAEQMRARAQARLGHRRESPE